MASSGRGMPMKSRPTTVAHVRPMAAATSAARALRAGRPAPRFWPATAAVAPMRPTEVHVISANSSV